MLRPVTETIYRDDNENLEFLIFIQYKIYDQYNLTYEKDRERHKTMQWLAVTSLDTFLNRGTIYQVGGIIENLRDYKNIINMISRQLQ